MCVCIGMYMYVCVCMNVCTFIHVDLCVSVYPSHTILVAFVISLSGADQCPCFVVHCCDM